MSNEIESSEIESTENELAEEETTLDEALENSESEESEDDEIDESEEAEEGEQGQSEDEDPRGVQKRIGRLTAQKKALEEQKQALEKRLQASEQAKAAQERQPVGEFTLQNPKKSDFENEEDWVEALIEYKQQKKDFENRKESEKKQAEMQQISYEKKRIGMLERATEKYEDFDDVVINSTHPVFSNQGIALTLIESPNGDDVAYYLAKNPKEADRINGLPIHRALAEIGRLEASLASTEKKKTNAPEPIGNLKGTRSVSTKKLENMSQAEYEAHRMQSLKRKRW